MRLYSLNKRQFLLVFAGFFVAYGLTLLVGVAGPPMTKTDVQNATGLVPKPTAEQITEGRLVINSPSVGIYYQQLWMFAKILTGQPGDVEYTTHVSLSVQITGQDADDTTSVTQHHIYNRSRVLRCREACEELVLFHLGYLHYPSYIISVQMNGLQALPSVSDIVFTFKTYNPDFTQLEIWFRFTMLVLSFFATCVFAHSLRRYSLRDWSVEQKWLSALLPSLLLYNDPVFPLTFLVDSWLPGVADALFQATFIALLLLFWLCTYHAIRQTHRPWLKFYAPKVLLVGLLWLAYVTLSAWEAVSQHRDPTYRARVDTHNFNGFKIFFFIMGGLYLLYLLFLLIKAYSELRNMPYFDLRLKFMTALVVIVLIITATLVGLRFGSSVLQENFVAEMTNRYDNSVEFTAFFGLLNSYLLTMAFVYSPSRHAVLAENGFKDNPAFSMLDDSDEDVIYGSDEELNTRRPLHRK